MGKIADFIGGVFGNVADTFSGSYSNDNIEIRRMRNELAHEDVPSVGRDRQNLKEDGSKVASDYTKAFETRKAEMCCNG